MSKCTIAIDDYPVGVNRHGSGRGRTIQLWNGAPQRYGQYMEDVQADASVLGIDVESMGAPSIYEYVTDPLKEIVNKDNVKELRLIDEGIKLDDVRLKPESKNRYNLACKEWRVNQRKYLAVLIKHLEPFNLNHRNRNN